METTRVIVIIVIIVTIVTTRDFRAKSTPVVSRLNG